MLPLRFDYGCYVGTLPKIPAGPYLPHARFWVGLDLRVVPRGYVYTRTFVTLVPLRYRTGWLRTLRRFRLFLRFVTTILRCLRTLRLRLDAVTVVYTVRYSHDGFMARYVAICRRYVADLVRTFVAGFPRSFPYVPGCDVVTRCPQLTFPRLLRFTVYRLLLVNLIAVVVVPVLYVVTRWLRVCCCAR